MTNILLSSLLFLGDFGFENEQKDKDTTTKKLALISIYIVKIKPFYETIFAPKLFINENK